MECWASASSSVIDAVPRVERVRDMRGKDRIHLEKVEFNLTASPWIVTWGYELNYPGSMVRGNIEDANVIVR